jgi:phytoene dehydrogenase-like protein
MSKKQDTASGYDAIVIGGGHNGLVNAGYLAKAGLKVLVLEQRHLVGGAAITEELRPGFSFTTFSYALSLLRPEIIHELELTKHGFLPLMMPSSFHPTGDGDYLLFGDDHAQNVQMIRRHSPHDADAYTRYHHDLDKVCQAIQPFFDNPPPNIFGTDPQDQADVAWMMKRLGRPTARSSTTRTPAHRQRPRLAGGLFRAPGDRGLPRVVGDHRPLHRADVRRLRFGAALPQDGRA